MRMTAAQFRSMNMARLSGDTHRANPVKKGRPTVDVIGPREARGLGSPFDCQLAGSSDPAPFGFEVDLPLPPSMNNLYANARGKGRVKTTDYRQWLNMAALDLGMRRTGKVSGWYALAVRVPIKMRGDNHNRFKAIGDLLVTQGLIDDDRYEFSTFMIRDAAVLADRCIVRVDPVSPAPIGGGCGPKPLLASSPLAGAEAT
jgi:Holliday junction resolvase RusA-like endonuclease